MLILERLSDLHEHIGQVLGKSKPIIITQRQINAFAQATLDEQWIHTSPEKAKLFSPYKTTIAHGYLTQSLIPYLLSQVFKVNSVKMGVNYGSNKVRFMSPVPVNSSISLTAKLVGMEPIEKGYRITTECTIEILGEEKPACVAELVTLQYE